MRTNKYFIFIAACAFLIPLLVTSCKQGDDVIVHVPKATTTTYKLAVVMPLGTNSEYQTHLKNSIDWALENLRNTQNFLVSEGDTVAVNLELEYHDEDSEDLTELGKELSSRSDILLVVGPLRNENVNTIAKACKETNKTLIVPNASSENVIRRYAVTKSGDKAERPFLWSLCETNVSQCEALLVTASEAESKSIALITPDDEYGQTFYEWIPFLANELGLSLFYDCIKQYTGDDLAEKAAEAFGSGVDCVVSAPRDVNEAKTILEAWQVAKAKNKQNAPRLLFSDQALTPALLELGDLAEGVEGIAPYANPSTGFQAAYEGRFGISPTGSDAQVYDAILLAGLAASQKNRFPDQNLNDIIRSMTTNDGEGLPIWNELGLRSAAILMGNGMLDIKLVGACGPLLFDSESCTSLVQGTYAHWLVYGNKFVTIDFYTDEGDNRTSSISAAWNHKATIPELPDVSSLVTYEPLKNRKAVLIQGTNGWANYRHQADVLNFYQMLKSKGWDDDDIILIIADGLVNDARNIYQGQIRCSTSSPDLYATAKIDYSNDSLSVEDIRNILLGVKSNHLPVVLESDSQTNVLLFWSGHGCLKNLNGVANGFTWRSNSIFGEEVFESLLGEMCWRKRYRKMLMLLEPCYSRIMAQCADGLPGILGIAAAGTNESSFADFHSSEMGTWMSDRFSNNLVAALAENSKRTYKELYEYLYRHTLGSHVYVENSFVFENLYTGSPDEFVNPSY